MPESPLFTAMLAHFHLKVEWEHDEAAGEHAVCLPSHLEAAVLDLLDDHPSRVRHPLFALYYPQGRIEVDVLP